MCGDSTGRARRQRFVVPVITIFLAVIVPAWHVAGRPGLVNPSQATITHVLQFSPSNAWSHLATLVSHNPRYPGTAGINQSAAYIASTLVAAGGTVIQQNFTIAGVPCKNVIGKWEVPGNASADIIILASHYDARANATRDPDPGKRTLPVPAANDGGSSTAILLDMARVLDAVHANASLGITRETWLVFFDAEDQGNDGNGEGMPGFGWTRGSSYMANTLASLAGDASRVKFLLLLDMVGGTSFQADQERNSDQQQLSAFFSMARCLGHGMYFPETPLSRYIEDDHVPFKNIGIPCIDVIDLDYPQWHTTSDGLAHVSAAAMGAVGKVAEGFMLARIAPSTALAIVDPGTGATWTASSCTGASWWFLLVAFLGDYWWLLALAGLAIIAFAWHARQNVHPGNTGEKQGIPR